MDSTMPVNMKPSETIAFAWIPIGSAERNPSREGVGTLPGFPRLDARGSSPGDRP
jgi:hypothetical protein